MPMSRKAFNPKRFSRKAAGARTFLSAATCEMGGASDILRVVERSGLAADRNVRAPAERLLPVAWLDCAWNMRVTVLPAAELFGGEPSACRVRWSSQKNKLKFELPTQRSLAFATSSLLMKKPP